MTKITIEELKNIEFKTTVNVWQLIPEFIIELALVLGLKNSDVLDLLGINFNNDPTKIQLNQFVEYYSLLPNEEKENLKSNADLKHLDFNQVESLSKEYLEKIERFNNVSNKFLELIKNIDNESNVYKKAIDILALALNKPKDVLYNTNLIILIELIYKLFYSIKEESIKGFFFTKKVKNLLTNTYLLNFIKTVRLTIQNGL